MENRAELKERLNRALNHWEDSWIEYDKFPSPHNYQRKVRAEKSLKEIRAKIAEVIANEDQDQNQMEN